VIAPHAATTFSPGEVAAYLARIGYDGPDVPTLETLRGIYRAHLFNVPFENLDIVPLGRPLSLDPAALYDKIVLRHRGGFCYELNGLLGTVLRDLGYDVTIVSVQFVEAGGTLSPPFDHMALLVTAADSPHTWLVDGGAGRTSTGAPLPLIDGFAEFHPEVRRSFRLSRRGDRWQLDTQLPGENWTPDYTFQPIPRILADFRDRCRYQEQHPDAYFRQGLVCSLATPTGRVTLSKDRLITTVAGEREERTVREDEVVTVLWEVFGIDLYGSLVGAHGGALSA
jgi:N-hydroxyarylamine O-acetyltransferase